MQRALKTRTGIDLRFQLGVVTLKVCQISLK